MKKTLALLLASAMVFGSMSMVMAEEEETSLTVAIGSQFTTLDPALNTEVVNNYAITHMYAGMFTKDEDNNPEETQGKDTEGGWG